MCESLPRGWSLTLPIVRQLELAGRHITDGLEKPSIVEPIYPFQSASRRHGGGGTKKAAPGAAFDIQKKGSCSVRARDQVLLDNVVYPRATSERASPKQIPL